MANRSTPATRRDGVYTRADREGFWGSYIDAAGRRRQVKLQAPTLQQARQLLADKRAAVAKARVLGYTAPTERTFADYAAEFLRDQQRRISPAVARGKLSRAEYERQCSIVRLHLLPFFGPMRLAAIRRADVIAYRDKRVGAVADGSVIKELNCLKRMFNVACDRELIPASPAQRVAPPAAPAGHVRYLQPEELRAVLAACPAWLRPIAGLCAALGTRRGELLAVRLPDIDLAAGTILLRHTKNGAVRPAFLNAMARQVLAALGVAARQQRRDRGLLFPGVTPAQVTVAFIRACKQVGIEDFSLHDLRHTFASHARMSGVDLHVLQLLLGHADARMTARYSHLSADFLGVAARKLDGVLTMGQSDDELAANATVALPEQVGGEG
jgi:integrase